MSGRMCTATHTEQSSSRGLAGAMAVSLASPAASMPAKMQAVLSLRRAAASHPLRPPSARPRPVRSAGLQLNWGGRVRQPHGRTEAVSVSAAPLTTRLPACRSSDDGQWCVRHLPLLNGFPLDRHGAKPALKASCFRSQIPAASDQGHGAGLLESDTAGDSLHAPVEDEESLTAQNAGNAGKKKKKKKASERECLLLWSFSSEELNLQAFVFHAG